MSRRLKVLVLSAEPPYPPTHGGARLKLCNVLKFLNERHELTLLTFLETPDERDYLPALKEICSKVRVFDRKPISAPPTLRERFQAPFYKMAYTEEMAAAIQRELRESDFDLVHVDMAHMAVYTPLLRGKRKLLAAHDSQTLSRQSRLPLATTFGEKLRARWELGRVRSFEQTFFPEYDECVVVAEEDRATLRWLCPTLRVEIIPNGIDLDFFRPTPRELEETNRLVFTGTMDFRPNVDAAKWFVAEILPLIRKQHPDAIFQVIGRNPTEDVRALAKVNGVEVTGFVADFRPLVARASVYVCPLRVGSGMKNKTLEAMAMGKAIVTTSEGASGIGGREGVEFVIAEDAGAFAQGVTRLMDDPMARARLGTAGRIFAEVNYSWERTGELFADTYERIGATRSVESVR
jgi:sugar transferase (PEP-CTERM/EpsH1 system associated)